MISKQTLIWDSLCLIALTIDCMLSSHDIQTHIPCLHSDSGMNPQAGLNPTQRAAVIVFIRNNGLTVLNSLDYFYITIVFMIVCSWNLHHAGCYRVGFNISKLLRWCMLIHGFDSQMNLIIQCHKKQLPIQQIINKDELNMQTLNMQTPELTKGVCRQT